MEQNNMQTQDELFIPKTKHKALKIIIGIILLAGLGVGGYFLYQYKFNDPKTIVKNVIEDTKADLEKSLVSDIGDSKYKVDGYIKLDTNITGTGAESIQLLKDLQVQFNGEIDPTNSIGNITINTKYKNDKLLDFKTYFEKDTSYVLLDGIYDKYIKVENETENSNYLTEIVPEFDVNPKDIQSMLDSLLDSVNDEIEKLDLKSEKTTITIDGNEKNVINNYVEFKNEEVNNFIKKVISNLKSNSKFKETIKKLTDTDANTFLDQLSSTIDEDKFEGNYKLNFYTDNSLFNKKLVSIRQTIIQNGISFTLNVDKISDDEIEVSLTSSGVTLSVRLKKNNSAMNIIVSETIMGMYLKVEVNMNYEKINTINKPDLSNSKDVNDLTEKELSEIEEKLMKNQTFLILLDGLESMVPSVGTDA